MFNCSAKNCAAVALALAACGPASVETGDDSTSDTAADSTSSTGDTGEAPTTGRPPSLDTGEATDACETECEEPCGTACGAEDSDETAEPPPPPACDGQMQVRVIVDGPADHVVAAALAPRGEALVLGGTPGTGGLAVVDAGGLAWTKQSVQADALLFIGDVVPAGEETVLFGRLASDEFATGEAVWMGRVDGDGALLNSKVLGSAHFSAWGHVDARVHPDGGFFVSADDGVPFDEQAIVLMHVDDAGEVLWSAVHALAPGLDTAINWSLGAMDVVPGGAVQLTASADGVRVIRSDLAGAVVWDREYAGTGWPRDIVGLPDGGVAVLAATDVASTLLRLGADGEVVGKSSYEAGGDSDSPPPPLSATALALDPGGGFLMAGGTRGIEGPNESWERVWLTTTDATGAVQWIHVGEPGTPGHIYEARSTGPGAYALTGHGEQLWVAEVRPCE